MWDTLASNVQLVCAFNSWCLHCRLSSTSFFSSHLQNRAGHASHLIYGCHWWLIRIGTNRYVGTQDTRCSRSPKSDMISHWKFHKKEDSHYIRTHFVFKSRFGRYIPTKQRSIGATKPNQQTLKSPECQRSRIHYQLLISSIYLRSSKAQNQASKTKCFPRIPPPTSNFIQKAGFSRNPINPFLAN